MVSSAYIKNAISKKPKTDPVEGVTIVFSNLVKFLVSISRRKYTVLMTLGLRMLYLMASQTDDADYYNNSGVKKFTHSRVVSGFSLPRS